MMTPWLLVDLGAVCLFAFLAVFVTLRRPLSPLWLPVLCFQLSGLLFVIGDAITSVSTTYTVEQIGIAILYSGGLPVALIAWIVAVQFSEANGVRLAQRTLWVRVPVVVTLTGWLVMLTNPWHGLFLTPVIGARNEYGPLWWPIMGTTYAWVLSTVPLYARLWWRHRAHPLRSNVSILLGATFSMALPHWAYVLWPMPIPFDPSVIGLAGTGLLIFSGIYWGGLFSLLPVALSEIIRCDSDGILLMGSEGQLLHANPAAVSMLSLSEIGLPTPVRPLLGRRLRAFPPEDDRLLERILSGEAPPLEGHLLELRGAEPRWVRIDVSAIVGRRGSGLVSWIRIRDVTDAHRALEARRAAEQRYRSLFDHSLVGIVSCDRSGKIVAVNQHLVEMLGSPSVEATMQINLLEARPIQEAGISALIERCLETGQPQTEEIAYRSVWGELMEARLHIDALRDTAGEVVGAQAIVADISQAKQAERERQRFAEQIEHTQRLESLGVLAGGIAHDFNNILSAILGNAELAAVDLPRDSPASTGLAEIRSAAGRASEIVDQMLTYAGHASRRVESIDLSALVRETSELLATAIGKDARVDLDLGNGLPCVDGDGVQLRQVIMNLITNASDALEGRPGEIVVRTGLMEVSEGALAEAVIGSDLPPGPMLFASVADTGSGIDERDRRRIFEPFYTTKFAGRGLGLAAVLGIVHTHEGALLVDSAPGQGASFTILLPVSAQSSRAVEVVTESAASSEWAGSGVVLVVDDEDAVRRVVSRSLQRLGFTTLEAEDGPAALQLLGQRADEIRLVLLDVTMPGMSGDETLERVRAQGLRVPVLLMSGFAAEQALSKRSRALSNGFLHKPFRQHELLERVREAIVLG